MVETLKVRDAKDVEMAVREAIEAEQPLEIVGHGSKRDIGQPVATNAVLDLSALNAVTSYEPHELIVTVQAGAPVADVIAMMDAKNQEFAFEPMDTSVLLGTSAGQGTIGGMIASGLSGPRRIRSGGVRDHLLGGNAVSGFGDAFVAGSRVVKNVTGYDISKLLAGSWGTLAVLTEATIKLVPKAEAQTTLVLRGLGDATANKAMTKALGSSFDVSAAAHVPASNQQEPDGALAKAGAPQQALTLVRVEGIDVSVAERARSLAALLSSFGAVETIADDESAAIWAALRDVTPFAATSPLGGHVVWRIVCPPTAGAALGMALKRETGGEVIYGWGGGLVWAALPPAADAHAAKVRAHAEAAGGHAMLLRAPKDVRAAIDVFHPQAPGVAALSRHLKHSFDPRHILNRGRMRRDDNP
ncbi:putative FAD-linked oxidoreductase [Afipia felis]|uniref:FAD-linked oxidoreductase n=1 Tax=Afipia felis TaxID=1035 RepID=A0A090N822_AFIFE|nr:FAD-binding protein [Afipia felis]CEG09383.1 putative FAD-linked oxidoreductase [Afipia felis]